MLTRFRESKHLQKSLHGEPQEYWKSPPVLEGRVVVARVAEVEDHVQALKLPHIPFKLYPDAPMSVHELGSFSRDPVLRQRLDDTFSGRNTFLVNVSGSGKTRQMYEGCCKNWALYFTIWARPGAFGIQDLYGTIRTRLRDRKGFTPHVSSDLDETTKRAMSANNLVLADIAFGSLLLIRLLALKTFLEAVSRTPKPENVDINWRKLWLEVQLRYPSSIDLRFDQLYDKFAALPPAEASNILGEGIVQTLQDISTHLNIEPHHPLFVVVDQAEIAMDNLQYAFWRNGKHYSVLKVIIRIWRKRLEASRFPFAFVVAGSRISALHFDDPHEWDDWVWSSNTGAFDDEVRYGEYVRHYLPPMESRDQLVKYMWDRLRGRYSLTAFFIGQLLETQFRHPRQQLDAYVHVLAGKNYWSLETGYNKYRQRMPFHQFDFHFQICPSEAACYMHEALLSVLLRGDSFATFPKDRDAESVISNFYGRFTDTRCNVITIDEPILLAGGGLFFVAESDRSIVDCDYLCKRIFVTTLRPRHSAAYSALCVASALDSSHGRTFSEIFTTSRPSNAWWNTKPSLVFTERTCCGRREAALAYSRDFSQRIATWTRTPEDVLKWLRSRATTFCVHVPDDGTAILMFTLKLTQEERVWVFLNVVSPSAEGEDTGLDERMRAAAGACHPHNMFGEISSKVEKALKSLPKLSRNAGELGVLRVLVSFSEALDVLDLPLDPMSPIALLDMDTIRGSTKTYKSEEILKCIMSNLVPMVPLPPAGSR
ncbi:hypothetical protein PM082_002399 [Marasmius tenuissimus]|nr:hypothetical protein PM082_002399 [Marasmius tenuissimus]